MNDTDQTWLLWQLADSAFPSGGFAHSGGLEAAWQHGEIRDSNDLVSFLESALWQVASGAIPFVTAAHLAPARLPEIDEFCDSFLTNHVANRASRLQGRAFASSAARIFGAKVALGSNVEFGHFAPVFGAIAKALEISREAAAELFAFQSLRGYISAAVRLGIVGPMEGQAVQFRLREPVREMILLTSERTLDDVAGVAPLLDIWQGSQDRLYSRLFQT